MPDQDQHHKQDKLLLTPAPGYSIQQVRDFVSEIFELSGNLAPLDSERDQNFRLTAQDGKQYVIKIANQAEDRAIIEMQLKALEHLAVVDPLLPVPEVVGSRNGLTIEQIQDENNTKNHVRLISYLPGANPKDNPTHETLFRPIGACLARLALGLRGFFHPVANYDLLWDLKHTAKLRAYFPHITDSGQRQLVNHFLDRFDQHVAPLVTKLRAQIVHNDLVPDNILVAENDPGKVVGIIDFGDMTHTLLINDLATTIAAMLRGHTDPVRVAIEIVSAYHDILPLEAAELRLLYDLIAARLVMLNVIAIWRVTLHPENREYITGGVEQTWSTLEIWRALEPAEVTKKFLRTCGYWEMAEGIQKKGQKQESLKSHLLRRDRLLGPCTYLFYDQPLHMVRGQGVWLYDIDGNRYLDAYNNVSHIGHNHPHVVDAISKQARLLNTSTRYMHGLILDLAQRITHRLPEELSVCMFVCTGSEANELAWQMSRVVSGSSGALISKFSYHGNTTAISQFSTEIIPESKLPPHVQTIFPPSSNSDFPLPDAGISEAIIRLKNNGHPPAMLILDTAFVSDGIFTSPRGYLKTLYEKTHHTGGLCVADEVQGGFGRFGQYFWGFEYDDVIPDIVTLGKPIGNGHPLAAVVTRPEIAEALAKGTGYFNTFGGNPVSCAAGLAVLDVIEQEKLQKNARVVGKYLLDQLEILQEEYPSLGSIHGSGLLLGIDILKPDGEPDPELAERISNQMRENGVLIGTTGSQYHTLKIRPPIVFQEGHVEIFLAALRKALN